MSSFSLQQLSKHTYPSACVNLVHCMDECILTPQSHTLSHTVYESASPFIYSSHHTKTHTLVHVPSELYSKSFSTVALWMSDDDLTITLRENNLCHNKKINTPFNHTVALFGGVNGVLLGWD